VKIGTVGNEGQVNEFILLPTIPLPTATLCQENKELHHCRTDEMGRQNDKNLQNFRLNFEIKLFGF
jgi:hypothetical protein